MSKDTGGPAFPSASAMTMNKEGTWPMMTNPQAGMTLRDYFAAKALQGILSSYSQRGGVKTEGTWIVECSYGWADAMLAERAK